MTSLSRIKNCLALTRINKKSGQAATELAIFGSVMLMILAAMINYGQTLATQQELEMYAFRRALQLSRARYLDNGAARQVGFTVFREVYPVALGEPDVQRQKVSGSASVDWESDSGTLTGEDPEDFGVQYWQLGTRMIKNNEMIQLPRMKVKRERDMAEVRGFLETVWDVITGGGGNDPIDVWTSAPVDQSLSNNIKITNAREDFRELAGRITNTQNITSQENNNLTMVMQSVQKIRQWDPKIASITQSTIPGDITILESENINKTKTWQTQIK
jgi:hypothetical protein